MDINIYFDRDVRFLAHLVQGSQNGFDIKKWMQVLYPSEKNNDNYTPKTDIVTEPKFPCIIVIHKSLFDLWSKDLEQRIIPLNKKQQDPQLTQTEQDKLNMLSKWWSKVVDDYQKPLKQHLQQQCSFFNNSSIWVRIVDWQKSEIDKAVEELDYFKSIGLYGFGSAKENLEYNIRLQKQNYLDSTTQGHAVYVTPQLYGDETEHWKILFEDNKCV